MATEEEAREAADGKEVQVEAVDLEPFHMQTHLDSKLSSLEIKNVAETIGSTEGMLKIPEDQVLVDAPSKIKLPLEHNLNGTSSSLNGHMDEENKISNEQLHEDSKKDHEQVEAALDGESTDQNKKINNEANDCLSHGETRTEDSSLLKHENEEKPKGDDQQDEDPMPDTLKTRSDIDQSKLVVDQLDHNMDWENATEGTQPACTENISSAEVVTEVRVEVQSPLYPNLGNSDATLNTVDGSTETDEAGREDGGIHFEHRESFLGDTSTAKHTEEMVKAEDQQSKQADTMDADAVQEDIPNQETDVSEEMPKSEHADESTIDAQEVLHQEPSEDTNGPAYEKKEQTSQHSSMAVSDDTTSEYDSTTCEPPSYEEDKEENGVTVRGLTTNSQEVDNRGSTEEIMNNVADNIVEVTNVAAIDEANKEKSMLKAEDMAEKHMSGIESDVTKSTEPVETEEESDQRHVSLLGGSAQGDNTLVSEKQHTWSALEINKTEATRTEAVPEESNASVSEEPSPGDYVTESETTSDAKEINTTESLEAIEGDKDTKSREMPGQNMDSVGKSTQENNAPESEPTSEIQREQEPESEEMKVTELAQVKESSPEISATIFHEQIQENNPTTSELHVMESEGGVRNIEATKMQATPHQLNSDHPEEKAIEETITSSEPQTLEPESLEKMNGIEATKPQDVFHQSIISPSEKSIPEEIAKEDIVPIEPDDGHQQPQDLESAKFDEIKTNKSQEIASSSMVSNYEEPTSEDNVAVTEPNPETQADNLLSAEVMEDTENVKCHGALAGEAAQKENVETEEIVDISPVQEPELEEAKNTEPVGTENNITPSDLPAERMEKETVEVEAIPYESPIASGREVTENDILTATTPHADIQPVLKQESVEDKRSDTTENPRETQQIVGSASDEVIPTEDNMATAEPACETPLQNVIAQGIKDSEDAQTDQFSNLDSFPTPGEAVEESKLPRIEPTSDVQEVQELGSTEQTRGIEAMETEDLQQQRVSTLEEPAVDNKPNVDDSQVYEEKPAELKDNEAMEIEPVLEQSNITTPDNAPEERKELGNDSDCCLQQAQQIESSKDSEDSKLLKEEETLDQKIITLEDTATEDIAEDEIDPPVGMEQEHEQKSLETSDVQEVQELGSTEQTRGIKTMENDVHQQQRISTLEKPAVDNKPNVDNHQVHEESPAELNDNEAMEAEPVLKQSNISTSDRAPEERSELGNDPDCFVQPAQKVESSRDSEDSKLLKEEETSDKKITILEETATEDIAEYEIDPPVVMEQEHEQKSVEEVKDISANKAKEDFHTSQPDALDKLASESNTATTEPTYDIQRLNDFETKEMKSFEGIHDGDISCEQTEIAASVTPSPTDNEIAPQEHPVESHEENLGNETENAVLPHRKKDEMQTSAEQKDDAVHLGETVPTAKKSKNLAGENVIQSSGEDTLESSNSTDQIKEGKKAEFEHNSSQKSNEHHGENIIHVQDKNINREPVTESAEASRALIENDAQASQDVTEKDDTMKSGEQTNDHRQAGDVEHQPQICESSVDDKVVQKVNLDEQHKEDEEVQGQKEQLQADEQKHKDEGDDVGNMALVESKNTENETTNRTEETNTLEAGQTEAVANEILKIEQALQTSEDSTPSITDTTIEDITGTDKGVEEENRPKSANTSVADSKMDEQEDQESTGKENIVPHFTSEQDETTDEITNKELEPSLASSVQEISHTSPSKDHILENDPIAVPYNAEPGGHEDKECTNKVNDDLLAIQEPEKEIVDGMQENKEMQNETKGVHHAESQTEAKEEDMSQLPSIEPYNADSKIDDTAVNTTVQPREIEEIGENKGLSSIYKPVVETSEQNNVEQDLSIHYKVEDEKLESTEDNAVELETTQQKVDTSNVDTKNDDQLSIRNSLTKHETESADAVLQLETEGNTFDKADETVSYEKTEVNNTSVPETVTFNEEMCDKVTEAEGGLSNGSLKTFDGTRRNLDASSVATESNEESMNKEMEEHKYPTMDENTQKQEISVSEKPLPTEPDEQEDDQIHKEHDEGDMHESDFGDDQKEVEQDLPVSNFLMNLILGKENSDANGHSEPEAETKQEETRDDKSCLIIPKEEESLVLPPTENNVEDKLAVEQEKKDVKCSEEKNELVEEQSHDLKLGTETSLETDAELNKNSHRLELPPYEDKMQDEISNEILSEEAAEVFTKMEVKDIAIPNIKKDNREVDTVCQENTAGQNGIGSLKNNLDDLNNTKNSEEDTLGEGQTGLLPECLNDTRSVHSVSEQTLLLTESGMTDANSLPSEADSSPNPVCEIQDKAIESSSTGTTSIPDIQVENEEDKAQEKQPTTTATGEVAKEYVEISNDNPPKSVGPEATSNEQELQITEQVSDTEIALGHEKKISAGSSSTFTDKKEDSNVSVKEGNNIQTAVEIQAEGSNMQINQDKQEVADNKTQMESEKLDSDVSVKEENNIQTAVEIQAEGSNMHINQDKQEAADNKTEMESEKLEESNIQEKQGNGTEEKSPKECHEEDQQFLVKEETVIKEEDVHETVKSHTETVKVKANDEQELSDSKVQERDLNVFSPKDVHEPEESFVDAAKPEFSTDEEQSPKADESNMSEQKAYEVKTVDEEKIKNFTDEEMKTEAQVAEQKAAHKKQNLLSGVGSKVKHQLAKVKKAITGKPGHTKPKSPKA